MFRLEAPGVYALLGPAGAGKSTLSTQLGATKIIHLDDYFIKDSAFRKQLLKEKEETSWEEYRDACNQMNWWNWEALAMDLHERTERDILLLEGAFIGPDYIWPLIDKLIFVSIPSWERLANLAIRDGGKRNGRELAHRFLITEYSETKHYRDVLSWFWDNNKLIVINNKGERLPSMSLDWGDLYLPKKVE